jgi:hypothetical protein
LKDFIIRYKIKQTFADFPWNGVEHTQTICADTSYEAKELLEQSLTPGDEIRVISCERVKTEDDG